MSATPKKHKVKPLTDAERLDYANDLDDIEECWEAGLALGRALLDIRNRKLYREEYKTWDDFVRKHPRVGLSRSYSYDLIRHAEAVEKMSAMADTTGLTERESRYLEAVASLRDRAEVLKRLRDTKQTINEKNIEVAYRELRSEEEAKDKERKELSVYCEPEPEPEGESEEQPELEAAKDDSQENRVKGRADAGEFDKQRRYHLRLQDDGRILAKNATKSCKEDYRDLEIRAQTRQTIALARKALAKVESWLDELDAEGDKAAS